MNPFAALPMFLSLTVGYDSGQQRRTAVRVVLYTLVMALVVMVGGQAVLSFFGVGIDAFRVAGGIVLMLIALGLLNGASPVHSGTEPEQHQQAVRAQVSDVAFYPMTFPMLMGPGTLTSLIVLTGGVGPDRLLAVGVAVLLDARRGEAYFQAFSGPAIVEQMDTTIVIEPGDHVTTDSEGNLLIAIGAGHA